MDKKKKYVLLKKYLKNEVNAECQSHLQNPGDITRPRATVSEFHYFLPGGVR